MTTTTATTYGAEYSHDVHADRAYAYINGGDYTQDQQDALVEAMMSALRDEVDDRLPEGVTWQPRTSELLHPVGADIPDQEAMADLFEQAWRAVGARYAEIEEEVLGALPATVAELERALMAIGEPVHRARVAGMLADAATAQMVAQVRQEAIFLATRERSREEVAGLLGTGLPAVAKAIKLHNARYVI